MAVTITTDTVQTTGILANTSTMGPRLIYASGTWDANAAATGTITTTYTGMSYIVAAGIAVDEAVSAMPAWAWNEDAAAATSNGAIGLQDFESDADNTGTWWAIGVPL
jgi:hypothetical protein